MSNLTRGQQLYIALEINLDIVPLDCLDKYIAIEYFLTIEDEPPENSKNIKKVDRYLQVFNHLCEASEWQKAAYVLSFCYTSKPLHEQLRIWGYYREQIELYQALLGNVNSDYDIICLYGLGRAFYNISNYVQSLNYYQQLLKLARLINNRQAEALALGGFGDIQHIKNNKSEEAIVFYQQQLDIAREIGDREQESYALNFLGYALHMLELNQGKRDYQQKGLNHLEEALEIARNLDNQEIESICLNNISQIYFNRGQYDRALIYLFRQLEICKNSNDIRGKYSALELLGECYMMLKQPDQARSYIQEALIVTGEMGDKYSKIRTLNGLGVLYCYKLKRYQEALPYFKKALEIIQQLNIERHLVTSAVNISVCYSYLENHYQSTLYLNMAQSLATKSNSLEDKGLVTMATANNYWRRDKIWYKGWGILLAIKGLMIIPPWRSANGRLAMQAAIKQVFGLE
ncbi:tetratricopeptide repeat protein [Anabaena cylindrica UHCC 0172]|uniref:tetratricopeptide repeat protein n=1 Tax=Anabaena cylindrica TaxID=1165 RepID=UPI002B1EF135|nr:tetratricopeptide repeat protein [Anabaena cylindrica]MEA5553733.1 tetratricopeptide repeat protein [Anabaena cylindrica UHCC 0172]